MYNLYIFKSFSVSTETKSGRTAYSQALYKIKFAIIAKLLWSFRCQVKLRWGQAEETAWCYRTRRWWRSRAMLPDNSTYYRACYFPVFSDYWNWRSQRKSGYLRLKRETRWRRSRGQRWPLTPWTTWTAVPLNRERYRWIPKIFRPTSSLLRLHLGWTICHAPVSTIPISLLILWRKMSRNYSRQTKYMYRPMKRSDCSNLHRPTDQFLTINRLFAIF